MEEVEGIGQHGFECRTCVHLRAQVTHAQGHSCAWIGPLGLCRRRRYSIKAVRYAWASPWTDCDDEEVPAQTRTLDGRYVCEERTRTS